MESGDDINFTSLADSTKQLRIDYNKYLAMKKNVVEDIDEDIMSNFDAFYNANIEIIFYSTIISKLGILKHV